MAYLPKDLRAIVEAAAPPDLDLAFRAMFGGILGYADGKPFVLLFKIGVALKLSGETREALLQLPGAKPLQFDAHTPPSKSYVLVPEAMLADPAELRRWLERGAVELQAAPKKPVKRRSRSAG